MPARIPLPIAISNPRKRVFTARDSKDKGPRNVFQPELDQLRRYSLDHPRNSRNSIDSVPEAVRRYSLENPSQTPEKHVTIINLVDSFPIVSTGSMSAIETKEKKEKRRFLSYSKKRQPTAMREENEQSECCPICIDSPLGRPVHVITPCKHVFNRDCLIAWLVAGDVLLCPTCRLPLDAAQLSSQS